MNDIGAMWNRKPVRTGALAMAAAATVAVVAGSSWLAMAKAPPKKVDPAPAAEAPAAAAPARAQPPAAPPQPAAAVAPAAPDIAARLRENGAGACAPQVDALAAGTMGNVATFNTVSKWATSAFDKRLVSVAIGQKYPSGAAVPYGATSVVASPNTTGSCDAVAVQVLPSPLPCAKLRDSLGGAARQVADLADIPLMQDAAGQTMLVPTAANTCVLVAVRTSYAK